MCHFIIFAVAPNQVYLIFHQGNQGRYHNGAAWLNEGGQLVA